MNQGFTYREQVGPETAGRTVLAHLVSRHRHSTEAEWQARLAAGEVRVGTDPASARTVLRAGEWLTWARPPWEEPPVPLAFAVLFHDPHLLAVAKPRGLPSVPAGGFLEHTLLFQVRRRWPAASPAHRLGRGTSGLLLFTLDARARRAVAAAWREGRVEKTYRARVLGVPARTEFTVEVPIGPVPHPRLGEVFAASPAGRPALSHVRCLASGNGTTLVEVSIPTGRPHQIRIHLAAAGHPLVGDPLYVPGGVPGPSPGLPGEGGYRLHAERLVLPHPGDGRRLSLWCAPPEGLR